MGNKTLFLLVVFSLLFPVSVQAATITVSPGQSIQSAANSANPGDTVSVSTGTYNEKVSVSRSGIIFQANGVVTMKGFYITGNNTTVSGFRIDDTPENGIEVRGSNSIIKNNIVTRGRNAGIFITGQNNLIENNDVSKIIQPKPHSSGGDANCMSFFGSRHTFRGNYCHDIYSDGVLVTDAHIDAFQTWNWTSMGGVGHDVLFEKNILMYPKGGKIWNVEEGAYNIIIKNNVTLSGLISLFIDMKNLSLINNTFVGTGSADGHHVRRTTVNAVNNIFANFQGSYGDFENLESSSTITGNNNCYYKVNRRRPTDPGDIVGQNPLFVNESSRDYHLQSNSPCMNKGAALTTVSDDKDGISRPQGAGYDIGAYEYTGTPAPTASNTLLQGDLDGDHDVDILDYNQLVTDFAKTGASGFTPADIDADGKVDIFDYNFLVGNFGKTS